MKKGKTGHLILICTYLLILLCTSVTFAWFFINKEIEVDYGSEITCEAGTSLEISMLEGIDNVTQEEIWSDYTGYIRRKGVTAKIQDITGDGKTLYRPGALETNPDTGELYPSRFEQAVTIDELGYGDFIELNLKLRSTSSMNVYLSGESFVEPVSTKDTDPNIFGSFSKDYIAGAVRVAILEVDENGKEELKMIWAPMPQIELIKTKNKYTLSHDGSIETYYYYKYNDETKTVEKYKVKREEFESKLFVLGSTNSDKTMAGKSPVLTHIESNLEEVIEKRLVVRLWYEGTDREADQALGGGHVNLNLKFNGLQEKESITKENQDLMNSLSFKTTSSSVNGINNIENIDTTIYYSVNDCYKWYPCTKEGIEALCGEINGRKKDLNVYLKYPESPTSYDYIVSYTFEYSGGAA